MQLAYCGIQKVREDTVRLNLVGARNLEGLGASGRLDLECLLLLMYPNWFSSGLFYYLEGGGEDKGCAHDVRENWKVFEK